jgi:predicted RNA-binding Zn-ribbon protein involved in translation (DUF1610 family)
MELKLEIPVCSSCGANLDVSPEQSVVKCQYCRAETVIVSGINTNQITKELSNLNSNYSSLVEELKTKNKQIEETVKEEEPIKVKPVEKVSIWYIILVLLSAISLIIGMDYPYMGLGLSYVFLMISHKKKYKRLVAFNVLALAAELVYLIVGFL